MELAWLVTAFSQESDLKILFYFSFCSVRLEWWTIFLCGSSKVISRVISCQVTYFTNGDNAGNKRHENADIEQAPWKPCRTWLVGFAEIDDIHQKRPHDCFRQGNNRWLQPKYFIDEVNNKTKCAECSCEAKKQISLNLYKDKVV